MKPLVIIPARGGSKGIPHKNIKLLGGKPLICRAIDNARAVAPDSDICVSTDDSEIIQVVEDYGLKVPFIRPTELAADNSGTYEVLLHALSFYEQQGRTYDTIILLQPTSPFRRDEDISEALKLYSPDVDMVPAICAVLGISIETLYAPTESEQINSQIKHKKSSHLTDQEAKGIKKYRALDPYGKDTVDAVLENELKRCQEQARPQKPKMHLMRMVASDGTYKERWMTDEEVQALKEQINTLEEPTGI